MSEPEEHDALVPPPFTAEPGPVPGQSWPGAAPQQPQPPQYGPLSGYPAQQNPYGAYGYGYPPPPPSGTNGMAIAAMVCGLCGFLCIIPGVVGIILGFVSLPQIRRTQQGGRGMAITGIVAGFVWIAVFVLLIALGHSSGSAQIGTDGTGN